MANVLHISTSDNLGGSGRAAYRIHTGLRSLGVRSRMLVGIKATDDPDVDLIARGAFLQTLDDWSNRLTGRLSFQYLFYPSSLALLRREWVRQADVVQLYNSHGGYFSHTVLPVLSRQRPVVWRLSDMWPMTGHCAYSFDCERWKTGCGSCPILSDSPELYRDTTALLWRIKDWIFARSALTIVAPSKWIRGLAAASPLLGRFDVKLIPNGLDTDVFRPLPREVARAQFGIPASAQVVLFSAHSILDKRKGAALIQEALERLAGPADSVKPTLVVVGFGAQQWISELPFEVMLLDHINSDDQLAALYSAADVFVLPTLAENLPNGVVESMACGTPAITFNVGGCPDAVRHMETGYLANYRDAEDLARGIKLILSDADLRRRLGQRSRQVVEAEYNIQLQAHRFKDLYQQLLAVPAMVNQGGAAAAAE
ncbi:MAG: glycosyltransferase family 4 protein [Pyrinomonadaceae bacterium]